MPEAFIIDAVRTPVTRRGGSLARNAGGARPCLPPPPPRGCTPGSSS